MMKKGQLGAVVVAHSVCNFLGVPRFTEARRHWIIAVAYAVGISGFAIMVYNLSFRDIAMYNLSG